MKATHVLDTSANHPALTTPRRSMWDVYALTFVVSDLVAFAAAVAIVGIFNGFATGSVIRRKFDDIGLLDSTGHIWGLIMILVVALAQLGNRGHYIQRIPFWAAARDIVGVGTLAVFCDLVISLKVYNLKFEAGLVLRWVLFSGLILLFRATVTDLLSRAGAWTLHTLIISPKHVAKYNSGAVRSDVGLGYSIVAMLTRPLFRVGKNLRQRDELVSAGGADYVALVDSADDPASNDLIVFALNRAQTPFAWARVMSPLRVRMAQSHYFTCHDTTIDPAHTSLERSLRLAIKRSFDIVVAGLLLLMLSPLLFAIAIMVRTGASPSFYRHTRVGFRGRPFGCIKFRSMAVNGDDVLAQLLANDPAAAAEWGATQKLRNDPRITRIGRFLRATSLDELPQLINVLCGEMSLVGPRPVVQSELSFYGDNAEYYMRARPGLTGLWQVSGRSDTTYDERVHLDACYVRNWTLWHDMVILMKTIPVVLFRRGAA